MKGGIQRSSPSAATPWITATSPDGATVIAIGDPSVPSFIMPSSYNTQGATVPAAAGGTSLVEPYENGVQFAQDYATRSFGQVCAPLQPTGTAAEPALAQAAQSDAAAFAAQVGVAPAQVQYDGGSAVFSCQANGVADAVGVIDVTSGMQTAAGGFWNVSTLIAYRTPAASQAQTDQLARAMRASFQRNPQWTAQMVTATRQQLAVIQQNGAAGQAAMTQLQGQESAMLNQQAQAGQDQLNAEHQATMDQLNAQGAEQTAAFNQQEYNSDTQTQAQVRYLSDQQCIQWYDAAHTRCETTAPN
jgi:2-oxo-4-hydroxy-4-carboxy--5-ureidoimidazoline (OHCU) decarboxylase